MSQKSHPYGYRLGINKDWKSKWIAFGDNYTNNLQFDITTRKFLEKELREKFVSDILIERNNNDTVKIIIKSSRPGIIIGNKGDGVADLKKRLLRHLSRRGIDIKNKNVSIDVHQIPNPESSAKIVAIQIRQALEKRMPFRRVMKQICERTMSAYGVKGVRVALSGRLGGAEMARKEEYRLGSIPLQTIRADIDYAHEEAIMTYGVIGIKVWVNKGEVGSNDK